MPGQRDVFRLAGLDRVFSELAHRTLACRIENLQRERTIADVFDLKAMALFFVACHDAKVISGRCGQVHYGLGIFQTSRVRNRFGGSPGMLREWQHRLLEFRLRHRSADNRPCNDRQDGNEPNKGPALHAFR